MHRGASRATQEGDMQELWTPERKEMPKTRKREGGSHFDDELMSEAEVGKAYADEVKHLLEHLNERPDHKVYVGSTKDRANMREVFNWWVREGALARNPDIRIDYGVADGAIRVGE